MDKKKHVKYFVKKIPLEGSLSVNYFSIHDLIYLNNGTSMILPYPYNQIMGHSIHARQLLYTNK
jgi:hypothetical protein